MTLVSIHTYIYYHLIYWATTEKRAKGTIMPKTTIEMQYLRLRFLSFLMIRMKQKKQGSSTAMEVEHIAPIRLKTASMSFSTTPVATITPKITKVQIQNNLLAWRCFQTLSPLSMQELICSTLSEFSLHFEAGAPSLALKSCMSAMKLFLQPKNMMGKAKKTERRNPRLTMKQMSGLLLGSQLMLRRKLVYTSLSPSIDHTKWYPKMPISRQEAEQTRMPVRVALPNLLSFTLRMPLQIGKMFIWNPKARIRLGMDEMAPNQSSGKVFMALPSRMSFSLAVRTQWITKVPMKTRMPATPIKAINFSLSIFLTRMEGISNTAMASAINVRLVYHSSSTSLGSTFLKISLMLSLKMMISSMQMPMLFRKIKIDPNPLQNLFWYT